MDIGFCERCKRWQEYRDEGAACEKCSGLIAIRWPMAKELEVQFAHLLLVIQHLADTEPIVKESLNPMWYLNRGTVPVLRERIQRLRGIAAQYGLDTGTPVPASIGQEIQVTIDGVLWRAFQGKDKSIRLIAPIDPVEAEAEATTFRVKASKVSTDAS